SRSSRFLLSSLFSLLLASTHPPSAVALSTLHRLSLPPTTTGCRGLPPPSHDRVAVSFARRRPPGARGRRLLPPSPNSRSPDPASTSLEDADPATAGVCGHLPRLLTVSRRRLPPDPTSTNLGDVDPAAAASPADRPSTAGVLGHLPRLLTASRRIRPQQIWRTRIWRQPPPPPTNRRPPAFAATSLAS
ncbi:Os10g0418300, partial [Oryza sativa Japonica Group]